MAGKIVGPMPGKPAPALGPQRPAQLGDDPQSRGGALLLDLMWP